MAVEVAPAAGDQRQPRARAAQQPGVLMGGAVMGDLEDIDRRERRVGPQEASLARWFEVTEEQQRRAARDPYEQRDTCVVGAFRNGDRA